MKKKLLTSPEPKANAQARGKRLQTLRRMAGLSRKALEEKYGISASTIQSWEAAKVGGLTRRGVKRLLPVWHQEGIACSEQWLLYGIGSAPQLVSTPILDSLANVAQLPDNTALIQELCYVRQLHPDWVDFLICDDGMAPHYRRDDVVAGRRHCGEDIFATLGKDCIVQTAQNDILFRRVMRSLQQPGCYHLACTNINSSLATPVLYDQRLISAAPVLWHRHATFM